MSTIYNPEYYLSRKAEIMEQYDIRTGGWKPFLVQSYGDKFTNDIMKVTRKQYEEFIPNIPYSGGDENIVYTREIIRAVRGLIFNKLMKARGKTAQEVGKIIYDAEVERVRHLPQVPGPELTPEYRAQEIALAKKSQQRRYPDDWVWEYVEGDGVEFDYGKDYTECGDKKLYHAHDADEFLPYHCYLDFVTHRTQGWGFTRTETLSEGCSRCNGRSKKGGVTKKGWPPPFLTKKG